MMLSVEKRINKKHSVLFIFCFFLIINFLNLFQPHSISNDRFAFKSNQKTQAVLENYQIEIHSINTRSLRVVRIEKNDLNGGGKDLEIPRFRLKPILTKIVLFKIQLFFVFNHFHINPFQLIDFYLRAPPVF